MSLLHSPTLSPGKRAEQSGIHQTGALPRTASRYKRQPTTCLCATVMLIARSAVRSFSNAVAESQKPKTRLIDSARCKTRHSFASTPACGGVVNLGQSWIGLESEPCSRTTFITHYCQIVLFPRPPHFEIVHFISALQRATSLSSPKFT